MIAIKKGNVNIFKGAKGGEARVGPFSAAGKSVPAGAFGQARASVLGLLFGASSVFGAAGVSVLGVSFGG